MHAGQKNSSNIKIAFIYKKKHIDLDGVCRKTSPTDFAYGAFDLIKLGYQVDFINYELWFPNFYPRKSLIIAINFIMPYLFNGKVPGEYIVEAFRLSKLLNDSYDILISTTPKMTLALACCVRWGNIYPKIIGIQTGLLNKTDRWYQKRFIADTLKFIHSIVLGEGEFAEIKQRYHLNKDKVNLIPFGVDTEFWSSKDNSNNEPIILSVGNDHFRDYGLLLKVAEKIPVKFIIVSKSKLLSGSLPPNVQIIKGRLGRPALTFLQLRFLYQSALCVVTPLKETIQPSGQSSTLQAMACGTPTVVANVKGIWSHKQVRDGETTLLYEPGDVEGCYGAIQKLLSNKTLRENISKNARQMVESQANCKKFAENLSQIAAILLGKKPKRR